MLDEQRCVVRAHRGDGASGHDLTASALEIGRVGSGHLGEVDDARRRRVKGRDPGRVGLDLPQLVGLDPPQAGNLVVTPAPLELVEGPELAFLRGHDHLPVAPCSDPALLAVRVELPRAGDAEPRLQRPRPVVDPRMDDAARAPGLMRRHARLALQYADADAVVAERQLAPHGEPQDPGADNDDVAFACGVRGGAPS